MFRGRAFSRPLFATALLATTPAFAANRDFNFDSFTGIKVSTGIHLEIRQGDVPSVRAETRTNTLLDKLHLEVKDGQLIAESGYGFWDFVLDGGLVGMAFGGHSEPNIKITVTMPELQNLDANSGSNVEATDLSGQSINISASSGADVRFRDAAFQSITINASSGAAAELDGACTTASYHASTGADINARTLECATAALDVSSGGHTDFFVSASVEGHISTGGNATVYGSPSDVQVETSTGGDFRRGE